jgi:hypothetical protein
MNEDSLGRITIKHIENALDNYLQDNKESNHKRDLAYIKSTISEYSPISNVSDLSSATAIAKGKDLVIEQNRQSDAGPKKLKCKRCHNIWIYKGNSRKYTLCRCKTNVDVVKDRID